MVVEYVNRVKIAPSNNTLYDTCMLTNVATGPIVSVIIYTDNKESASDHSKKTYTLG